ncbi:MAG: hypothetical protein JWO84_495 [Parcubacteria group bacterium]|nr:hypothetical protein [Parcubacteria group bacterium]
MGAVLLGMKALRTIALIGNGLYILWILWNAVDERAQGVRPVEARALSGLVILLVLNIAVLLRRKQ